MPQTTALHKAFTQFQDWINTNAPAASYRPPANVAAISNFEDKSNLQIPEELRQLLLIADGEARLSAGSIGNWRLMSIGEIQAAWGLLTQLDLKGAFANLDPQASPYLAPLWWSPAWIPFATNDSGGFFCIDNNPPEPIRTGQVLIFFQDWSPRFLVAGNLSAWFERINDDLRSGVYTYDEVEGFTGEAFLWSSLEGKHLLDAHSGKLITQHEEDQDYNGGKH